MLVAAFMMKWKEEQQQKKMSCTSFKNLVMCDTRTHTQKIEKKTHKSTHLTIAYNSPLNLKASNKLNNLTLEVDCPFT